MTDRQTTDVLRSSYVDRVGSTPDVVSYAPGRVECLGNHTDYNDGLAVSAAINMGIYVAAGRRNDQQVHIHALDLDDSAIFQIDDTRASESQHWTNYLRGLTAVISGFKPLATGFNAVITGTLPRGSGLASSAALTLAAAETLKALYCVSLSPHETAILCQRAEQHHTGVQCGLLDPLSIVSANKGQLTLIDFHSTDVSHIPFPSDLNILVCSTHQTHSLAVSAYNERRESCIALVNALKGAGENIQSLREVTQSMIAQHGNHLDPIHIKRAIHILGENERVKTWSNAIQDGQLEEVANCLYGSHQSSIDNFENSSPEQNMVVDALRILPGVHGARLTGGGFGGSVIAIVSAEHAESVTGQLKQSYQAVFSHECETFILTPTTGSGLL